MPSGYKWDLKAATGTKPSSAHVGSLSLRIIIVALALLGGPPAMLQAPLVLLVPRRLISGAREFLHQRRWGSVQSPGLRPSALQAFLSVTSSWSLLRLMSMESVGDATQPSQVWAETS